MIKMNYLSMDGGGTKLNALWFSDDLACISRAKSAGVNGTVFPHEVIAANIKKCYDELFLNHTEKIEIECMYVVCGPAGDYIKYLPENVTVKSTVNLGEAAAGLACGGGKSTGFVAVSGTGSDVFYVENGVTREFVGGWGAILGDEGSGVWMARQGIQAAIRYNDGWGNKTILAEMIMEELELKNLWGLIGYVYAVSERFYRIGQLLPIVSKAADLGDEEALNVFKRGAEMMSRQIITTVDRRPESEPEVMICGGAWKSHPVFFETCCEILNCHNPAVRLTKPWFEHVIAGPAFMLMEKGHQPELIEKQLKENFSDYIWRMNR